MADPITMAVVASTGMTALGEIGKGNAAEASGKFTARQNKRNAKASSAEGIRNANEIQRQGDQTKSDAAAAMAASGGVTDDVGAITTLTDIDAVTDYNALAAIYEGGLRSDSQNMQADMDKFTGKQAKNASRLRAVSTVMDGASKVYGNS